jgi:hypothetical protein
VEKPESRILLGLFSREFWHVLHVQAYFVSASGSCELSDQQTWVSLAAQLTCFHSPLPSFPSQRSPPTSTRHKGLPLHPKSNIDNMMALSPSLRRLHSPSRQILHALMLARRPQHGPRPSSASSPLMTSNLEALGHSSLPSCGSVTTEQTTNTYGAPKWNHSALNSLTTTSSTERLGWQFHFIIRLARDRAQTRKADARHDYQITKPPRYSDHAKWAVGAAIMSIARQPEHQCHHKRLHEKFLKITPASEFVSCRLQSSTTLQPYTRFDFDSFVSVFKRGASSAHDHALHSLHQLGLNHIELQRTSKRFVCLLAPRCWGKLVLPRFVNKTFLRLSATRAAKVCTSSPRSSRMSANSSQAKVAATAAATTGALLVVVPERPWCALGGGTRATAVCTSSLRSWKASLHRPAIDLATAKVAATAASRAVASGRDLQHLPPLSLVASLTTSTGQPL